MKKIGIALGGGGARGFAHIGVLKALAHAGIECDIVTGSSVGALVGAVYASGGLSKLEEASAKIKLTDIPLLLSPTWPRQGLFSGRKILDRLSKFVEAENIEDLKKPFAAVSVDINSSEIVPVAKGNLRQAVLASIAIPVIFTPVIFEGRLLVDGGMLEPIPVQAARSLGADFVVAVDLYGYSSVKESSGEVRNDSREPGTSTALDYLRSISGKISLGEWFSSEGKDKELKPNIIDIVERSLIVHQRYLTKCRLEEYPPDFIIKPAIPQLGVLDFHRAKSIIEVGEKATEEVLPKLIEEINNVSSG